MKKFTFDEICESQDFNHNQEFVEIEYVHGLEDEICRLKSKDLERIEEEELEGQLNMFDALERSKHEN